METVLKADIFFFIASIGVIIVTVVFMIIGYLAVKTLQEARTFIRSIRGKFGVAEANLKAARRLFGVVTSARFFRNVFRDRGEPREPFEYER